MISNHSFLTPEEAHSFKERLSSYPEQGVITPLDTVIGAPSDDSSFGRPETVEATRAHNHFMRSVFPDLLERVRHCLEALLKMPVYYDELVSHPGFNIFTVLPGQVRPLWFHFDEFCPILATRHPHLMISPKARQISFTVLLHGPPGLTAGLCYFPDQVLGKKMMKYEIRKHSEFLDFASFHRYPLGDMNLYEQLVHSVFARNDSKESVKRVTLQGHLAETPKGMLLFW